jgi:cell division protein FtsQ
VRKVTYARPASGFFERWRFRVMRRMPRFATLALFLILAGGTAASYLAWTGGFADRLLNRADRMMEEFAANSGFRVETIRLEGRVRTADSDLQKALAVKKGASLMHLDLEGVRRRLEALEWVAAAKVMRIWPGTLVVSLHERMPFAIWQYQEQHWLIDRQGTVISNRQMEDYAHLPQIVGRGANTSAAVLLTLLEARPSLAARVRAVNRIGDRRWNLVLDGGATVRLPEDGESRALDELVALESKYNILARGVEVIDLRFTDRLIVRLKEGRHVKPRSAPDDSGSNGREKGSTGGETHA